MGSKLDIGSRISNRLTMSRIRLARWCMPPLKVGEEGQLSMIYPDASDEMAVDSDREVLLRTALKAASRAAMVNLNDIADRMKHGPRWPNIWPGEHYKFLTALTECVQPSCVVEIGTFLGLSALSIMKTLPPESSLYSFDIFPWDSFSETCFTQDDFKDGRLRPVLGDLGVPSFFEEYEQVIGRSELIFMDGPKNGTFERAFLQQLAQVRFAKPAFLVIDDIRLWSMIDIWRAIHYPKLDITSLGHFPGTGLVLLNPA